MCRILISKNKDEEVCAYEQLKQMLMLKRSLLEELDNLNDEIVSFMCDRIQELTPDEQIEIKKLI